MEVLIEYSLFLLAAIMVPVGIGASAAGCIKRKAKWVRVGSFVAVIGVILLARTHFSEFWVVDGCLDSGGRFNYESRGCEFAEGIRPNEVGSRREP